VIAFLIRWSGIPFLVRNTYARRKVTVLVYHDPTPETLRRHLRFLARRYTFVTLDDLVGAIHARDPRRLPPKSLVLTFDDGHRGNFELLGEFARRDVRPTIYLCSQIVGTHRRYWFEIEGVDVEAMNARPHRERLAELEQFHDFTLTKEYPAHTRQALSAAEVKAMSERVSFGSHTRWHPSLPTCGDRDAEEEIVLSRREVTELVGQECRHFAYPNGGYTDRDVDLARRAGYASARTVDVGWNDWRSDPHRLKMTGMVVEESLDILSAHLMGARALRDAWARMSDGWAHGLRAGRGAKRRGLLRSGFARRRS
jgi:peptidoglycan/xylan/chitin deacetylase (PgdA/CDA1 family)